MWRLPWVLTLGPPADCERQRGLHELSEHPLLGRRAILAHPLRRSAVENAPVVGPAGLDPNYVFNTETVLLDR
jgi:hypothetical protein